MMKVVDCGVVSVNPTSELRRKHLQIEESERLKSPLQTVSLDSDFSEDDSDEMDEAFSDIIANDILQPTLPIDRFRTICWFGIPGVTRPMAWRLLLGYLPRNILWRIQTIVSRRMEYNFLLKKYYHNAMKTKNEEAVLKQIMKDVPRIMNGLTKHPRVQLMLARVLYLWSVHHPASSYVQGMNEIVVPFIHVFTREFLVVHRNQNLKWNEVVTPDHLNLISEKHMMEIETVVSGCFGSFMEKIQSLFIGDQIVNLKLLAHVQRTLDMQDIELSLHLRENGIKLKHFALQWFQCMFAREFKVRKLLRIWDSYISLNNVDEKLLLYHGYVIAIIILFFKKDLMCRNFEEIMLLMKNFPADRLRYRNIEDILGRACVLFQEEERYK